MKMSDGYDLRLAQGIGNKLVNIHTHADMCIDYINRQKGLEESPEIAVVAATNMLEASSAQGSDSSKGDEVGGSDPDLDISQTYKSTEKSRNLRIRG